MTPEQRLKIIEAEKSRMKRHEPRWDKFRAWYRGEFWDNQQRKSVPIMDRPGAEFETSYAYAFINNMTANVVPTNPQVTVEARRRGREQDAKAREALVNDTFVADRAHERLWKMAIGASLYGRMLAKAVWSKNLQRPTFRVLSPREAWFDQSAERWEDIRYIVEAVPLTRAQFEARVNPADKRKKGRYDRSVAEKAQWRTGALWEGSKDAQDPSKQVFEYVVVYEFYDFEGEGAMAHMIDGIAEPLFAGPLPFARLRNPFGLLVFNDNMEDLGGLGDIGLVEGAQETLNNLNVLEVRHAQRSIPVMLIDGDGVQDPETLAAAFEDIRDAGEGIVVKRSRTDGGSLNALVAYTQSPSLSPSWQNMKAEAKFSIEYVLGIPAFSRGVVGVTDVATEAALADTATRTRNGMRQVSVYDVVRWMGQATIALFEEFMADDQIRTVALGDGTTQIIDRQALGKLDRPTSPDFEFKAVPYSAAENNRLVQLRSIRDNWGALTLGIQAGTVDARKLYAKLADLLLIPNVLAEADAAPDARFGAPSGTAPPIPTADVIATGGQPDTAIQPTAEAPVAGAGDGRISYESGPRLR